MGCETPLKVDLHIHSTASDGTVSPCDIVKTAHDIGLGAIAITDHDTLAGVKTAIDGGIPPSLHFLTGIEVSAASPPSFPCSGSFHILGYGIRLDDDRLNHALEKLQQARKNRNPQIIEQLNKLGFSITLKEVIASAGLGQIGRPHIAQLMKQKGFVKSINEAFDRYIGTDKPAYVNKYRISCQEAVDIIQGAGGIAVLAHPGLLKPLKVKDMAFDFLIRDLKNMGLRGIEVYYPEHSPLEQKFYADIAKKYDLLITGGTDFHGDMKPKVRLGVADGCFHVPYAVYETLIQAI